MSSQSTQKSGRGWRFARRAAVVVGIFLWVVSLALMIAGRFVTNRATVVSWTSQRFDVEVAVWRDGAFSVSTWKATANAATAPTWVYELPGIAFNQTGTSYGKVKRTLYVWFFIPMFLGAALISTPLFLTPSPKPLNGRCRTCGYDLRASKDRCPECGTPILAADTTTNPQSRSDDIK